jgi:large subunit ribosomal protein L18
MEAKEKHELRIRRHERLRKKVKGTASRPRLAVFKSTKHFYAQIIDDDASRTLISASTLTPDLKSQIASPNTMNAAEKVGEYIAVKAKQAGIETVVFDHGGFGYHGKIKKFADKAREQGLKF